MQKQNRYLFLPKLLFCLSLFLLAGLSSRAQSNYDSITISRFLVTDDLLGVNWKDTLKAGRFPYYIAGEKTQWRKPTQPAPRAMGVTPPVIALAGRIKANGTEDVAKCFIPRHSINFYKGGKIVRYLLVCFECDGVRFSDDPSRPFIKSVTKREEQMTELKLLFKDLL